MPESFEISTLLAASPQAVHRAWLDPKEHGQFIGGQAEIDPRVGGTFRIWDGYITGKTLEIDPPGRIVQSWRTTEFPAGSPDSRLEVRLEAEGKGTRLTLLQTEVPDGQGSMYEQGWQDHYFQKMQEYFGSKT